MGLLTRREWALFAFILLYSFVPTFGGLLRILELAGGPAIAPENPRAIADPSPIVLHILSSFVFCIAGALQFLPSLRRNARAMHRKVGRIVAAAGLVSAFTGLWMTTRYALPTEIQGPMLYWARIVLSLSMIGLITWALFSIKARRYPSHGAAMLRAYAIGQGAATQAFLGIGWIIATGTEALGPLRDSMMIAAWLLNLAVAELVIRRVLSHLDRAPLGLTVRYGKTSERL